MEGVILMLILFIVGVLALLSVVAYITLSSQTGTHEEKVAQLQEEVRNGVNQDSI